MNPTIKDVAKRAGVSLSTVSLVMNQKKNVSPEMVKKVQEAIAELEYHPRRSAQGLASKKSGNLGFILTNDHFSYVEPFYTRIFLGSEFEARKYNYYILLTTVEQQYDRKSTPRFLLERNVDGVILAGKVPEDLVRHIEKEGLPMVFIDYFPARGKFTAVLMDNVDGANQAVSYLLNKGHRNIAFVGGDISHPSIYDRLQGFKNSLQKAGIPPDEKLIVTDESDTADINGYNAIMKLLKRDATFTAVFAANDAMAFGCIRGLKEKNIIVGEQVAVIGFDDVDAATRFEPNLTTIKVDKEEMGAVAVKNMTDMISNDRKSLGKILAFQFKINFRGEVMKKNNMR